MARNDLIVDLIRAGASGDGDMLRATVEAMAAEARARKNDTLATKLTRALAAKSHLNQPAPVASLPTPGRELVAETEPTAKLGDLILTSTVRASVEQLIEEQHRANLLRSHGLQPRHRILLSGPPGNGKTVLTEAIAESLGLPFFTVRYEALIGSFLGETAQRLGQLFAFARTTPCILFFDEFDVVGKERGDVHETGEIKRIVSNLLLQVDALPSHVVVVTATNHSQLLDTAVWRRFQLRLDMPAPNQSDVARFLDRAFAGFEEKPGIDPMAIARGINVLSYAEATEFVLDVCRRRVLSLGQQSSEEILKEQIGLWAARAKPVSHGKRSRQTATKARSSRSRSSAAGRAKSNPAPRKVSSSKAKQKTRTKISKAARSSRSRPRSRST